MRFGSVQFFKVLIKTVLAVVFFAPLIVAVILGVFLANKNKQLDEVNKENVSLSAAADVLINAKAGTAEDFYTIFSRSGVSYNDFLALLYKDSRLTAEEIYTALSTAGVPDKDIVSIAASKSSINGEEFYDIMTKNGVTDKDLLTAVINKNGSSPEKLRSLLKECGLNDAEIAAIAGVKPTQSAAPGNPASSTPDNTSSSTSDDTSNSTSSTSEDPNSSPGTPAQAEYMSRYPDLYVNAPTNYVREEKTIYFTFDDGPSNNISTVLWILRQHGIKATFFVVPQRGAACAQLLKAIAADGHAIGVHSATHEYETIYASVDAFLDDFYEAWDIIRDATGIETPIFRFPGGSNNSYNGATREDIIAEMTRRGFRFYDWNVQSNDILGHTWTQMYNTILSGVHGSVSTRSIVLFHDRADNGVNVLDDIIKVLLNEGYKFDKINDNTTPIQFVGPFSSE